jgi:hypothetical protein
MKTLKTKLTALTMTATLSLGAIAPAVASASDVPDNLLSTQNLKLSDDEKQMIIDANAALIKLATGVDIKSLPILSALFPKKDVVDYERIARDVSRIVHEAFVENNVFDQNAKLGTVVTGLKRLVTTDTVKDEYLLAYMAGLDNILHRTSQNDLKERAVGYYASAAQMSLNAMGMRANLNPQNRKLKLDIWHSSQDYRAHVLNMDNLFRQRAQLKAEEHVTQCKYTFYSELTNYHSFSDHGEPQWFYGPNQKADCERARASLIESRFKPLVSPFLRDMADQWQIVQLGSQYGEKGVDVFNKLKDPYVEMAMHLPDPTAMSKMKNLFLDFSRRGWYHEGDSACDALERAIEKNVAEGRFPRGYENRLRSAVGCQR